MKHKSLILLAIVAGAIMTIGPASAQSAGDITLAGAEDDADDCCDKCTEDEACVTMPTGCECWVPDTDDVAGGGGGSKLSGATPVMKLGDTKLNAGVAILGKDKGGDKLKPTIKDAKAAWDSRTKRVRFGRVGRLPQRAKLDLFGDGKNADNKERLPARSFTGLTRVGDGNVVTASRGEDTDGGWSGEPANEDSDEDDLEEQLAAAHERIAWANSLDFTCAVGCRHTDNDTCVACPAAYDACSAFGGCDPSLAKRIITFADALCDSDEPVSINLA